MMTTVYLHEDLCSDGSTGLQSSLSSDVIDIKNNQPKAPNEDLNVLQLQDKDIDVSKVQECYLNEPLILDAKYCASYLCRLCAGIISNLSAHNMFSADSFQDELAAKINKYLPIVVCETDPFPKAVCDTCVTKLNDFHDLVEKSILVEEHFRKMFIFDNRYFMVNQKGDFMAKQEQAHEFAVTDLSYIQDVGMGTLATPSVKARELMKEPPQMLGSQLEPLATKVDSMNGSIIVTSCNDPARKLASSSEHFCRFCNENIANVQTCLQHCYFHEDASCQHFVCILCEYLLTSKSERDIHVQAHFVENVDENLLPGIHAREKTKGPRARGKVPRRPLRCRKCKEPLGSVTAGVEHCVRHKPANIKSYPCVLCLKRVTRGKLLDHVSCHFSIVTKPILTCDNCDNIYPDEKTLKYHRCTILRKYKCSQCKQGFKSEHRLKFHEDFHKNKSTFCDVCKKDFKFESKIYLHFTSSLHNGVREKPFCCDECGKTFTWLTSLNSHKRTHSNERPYNCGKCEARFCNKYSLRSHMASHEDHPQFYCSQCEYHTGRKQNMQKHASRFHREIASSQTCLRCTLCDEMFPNKHHAEVERHSALHPPLPYPEDEPYEELTVTKLYQCERCERCYNSLDRLTRHRVTHPKDDPNTFYQCRLCDQTFPKHDLLVRHQKIHVSITSAYDSKLSVLQVITCDLCGMECIDYRQMLNHRDRGNCLMKKPDTTCTKKVLIKKHLKPLKTHQLYVNANGLFECTTCQRTYRNRRRYRLHLATHTLKS